MGRIVFEQSETVRKNWERLGGTGIDQSDKEEDGKVMNHLQSMLIGIIPSAGISSDERMDDQKHIRMDFQIKTTEASIAHTALSVPLLYRFISGRSLYVKGGLGETGRERGLLGLLLGVSF